MKNLTVLLFTFFSSFILYGQNLEGLWQGYITGEGLLNTSQYTLDVKKQANGIITGKAYLYSSELFIFQGIFDFIGTVNKNEVKITELKILTEEMPDSAFFLCIKYENLTFSSDSADYLKGTWGNTRGNCPPGKVVLKKVKSQHPKDIEMPEAVLSKIRKDKSTGISFLNTRLSDPTILNVKQRYIEVTLTDYLKEDNDTVTVYFNRKPIIKNHKIRKKPYTKSFKLDILSGLNELVVVAENLGLVPPNTCTMLVYDGISKQKISITTDKQISAAIYLNYTPGLVKREVIYKTPGLQTSNTQ